MNRISKFTLDWSVQLEVILVSALSSLSMYEPGESIANRSAPGNHSLSLP